VHAAQALRAQPGLQRSLRAPRIGDAVTRTEIEPQRAGPGLHELEVEHAGVLVWQRTYFPAWRADVDGVRAPTVAADGHLVGVELPAGRHDVRVVWPSGPAKAGLALAAAGLAMAAVLLVKRR